MLYKYLVGLSLCVFSAISFATEVHFVHGSHTLIGQYLAPTDNHLAKAVILFVHGDGATTFNADGYYDLIWSSLRARGYAIFSWDKPGVGQSTGNWLTQSMLDRQNEVHAAVETVQQKYGFTAKQTGLFGFSQAGWVVPALAHDKNKISFVIGVGFATNWGQQGLYYTKTQHQRAGNDDNQIANAVKDYANEEAFLATSPSYDAYLKFLAS
jgi:pimeloyl-ACP methyl ester carboxylesterase